MSRRVMWIGLVASALLANPQVGFGCPVCFSAKKESRGAYYGTTALLTLAPFVLIGAFVWGIRQRLRQLDQPPASAGPKAKA